MNIYQLIVKLVVQTIGALVIASVWLSERVLFSFKKKPAAQAPLTGAKGVRAVTPAQVRAQQQPPTAAGLAHVSTMPAVMPASTSPAPVVANVPADDAVPAPDELDEPDELDWAGSLNHAHAAATLLGEVLDQLEAGCIIVPTEHQARFMGLVERMAAFEDRTNVILAPLVETMSQAELQEFLTDFMEYLTAGEPVPQD